LHWLLVFLSAILLVSASPPFSAKEFFLGEWDVEMFRTSLEQPKQPERVDYLQYRIKDGNETLYGVFVDEKDEERPLRIEFKNEVKGEFQLAAPDEEDYSCLFNFEFSNYSIGLFVSQGSWTDEYRGEHGTYQLIATSPASFLLSVYLKDAESKFHEIQTFTARKLSEKPSASFLQRWGMPLALFGIIIVTQFFKGRQTAPPPDPARREPAQPSEASDPRITEVTEEDEDSASSGEGDGGEKKDK